MRAKCARGAAAIRPCARLPPILHPDTSFRSALPSDSQAPRSGSSRCIAPKSYPANLGASLLLAMAWGYFLYAGVKDPLGGVNSLWPLFGIANQLLACVALCLGTTILIKAGRARLSLVVLVPLLCLGTVTFTAGIEKIVHPNPRIDRK